MYLLAIQSAFVQGKLEEGKVTRLLAEMETLPDKISRVLDDKERIQWFASKYANAHDIFFIGRGIDYAISMEGSLKMKEISYIHSEAYAAGELKHGTISLVEDGTLVIGVMTQKDLFEKTLSNMVEVKSRGAYLMGLTSYGNYSIEDTADFSCICSQDGEVFYNQPCNCSAAADGILCQRGEGPGCGQAEKPCKICYCRIMLLNSTELYFKQQKKRQSLL